MKKILMIVSAAIAILFSFSLLDIEGNKAKAASIGEQLKEPEIGWKRYDDSHPAIIKKGYESTKDGAPYNGSYSYTSANDKPVLFDFTGDKVRIIVRRWNTSNYYAEKVELVIDGEVKQTFSIHGPTQNQTLIAEVTGLENKRHRAIIRVAEGYSKGINLDALDIDENGELLPPQEEPVEPEKPVQTISQLFVGNKAFYKLQANGDLYGWGSNEYGQLGLGDTKKRTISSKEKISIPEPVIDIIIGERFVIALGESGNVYGWGDNTSYLFDENGGLILSPVKFDENIKEISKSE
ncbi:hypothetical protein D0439_10250 [Lysinibacillus fusiformis]|uniref:hypothetical protein n=1 Tax=Lysinibacillus fusiformis TaxID=28031 RepID=UPI0011BB965E|nr:hypothetical protein [Lysinibacillus fusiformis]QDZ98989.1 hypothetical protein D0439_10250 [Lysinibacillus fusiformis]